MDIRLAMSIKKTLGGPLWTSAWRCVYKHLVDHRGYKTGAVYKNTCNRNILPATLYSETIVDTRIIVLCQRRRPQEIPLYCTGPLYRSDRSSNMGEEKCCIIRLFGHNETIGIGIVAR